MFEILSAVIKTGSGTFFTLILGILSTKIFAVNLGTSGIGLFSLLRQTRDTFLSVTTFHGGTALVQGLASRKNNERRQYSFVVLIIMIISTSVAVLILLIFAPLIAQYVIHQNNPQYTALIRWLSLSVILGTLMMYLGGLLNGYRAIGRLALVTVVPAIITAILAYPTTYLVNQGNLAAFVWIMALSSATGVLVAIMFVKREGWLSIARPIGEALKRENTFPAASYFLSFAFTTVITGLANTWTALVVRSMIVSQKGLSAAGIFDVAWTLSMMYISLALSSFGTYYLPTLSQCKDTEARINLIRRVMRLTLLLVVPLITAVIVLKPFVIHLLYSDQFLESLKIIRWMLIGDYLKATSWVFGVTITASADKKTLLITELLWQAGFLGLSALSLFVFQSLEGIGMAFAVLYLCYLLYTGYYAYTRHHFLPSGNMALKWLVGLLLLIGASALTWSQEQLNWFVIIAGVILALTYSGLSLGLSGLARGILFVRQKAHQVRERHDVK